MKNHQHDFLPKRRLNRLIILKCTCGDKKSELIKNFDKERAKEIDSFIEGLNRNSDS